LARSEFLPEMAVAQNFRQKVPKEKEPPNHGTHQQYHWVANKVPAVRKLLTCKCVAALLLFSPAVPFIFNFISFLIFNKRGATRSERDIEVG